MSLVFRKKDRCNGKHKAGNLSLGSIAPEYLEERSSIAPSGGTAPHGEAHTMALHAVNGYHTALSRGHVLLQQQQEFMADFVPISALNVSNSLTSIHIRYHLDEVCLVSIYVTVVI